MKGLCKSFTYKSFTQLPEDTNRIRAIGNFKVVLWSNDREENQIHLTMAFIIEIAQIGTISKNMDCTRYFLNNHPKFTYCNPTLLI